MAFPVISQTVPDNTNAPVEQQFANSEISIDKDIDIYPNPVLDYLTILINRTDLRNVEFELYNIIGNSMEMEVDNVDKQLYKVNLKEFQSGYYLLVIKDDVKKFNKAYKFQKQ